MGGMGFQEGGWKTQGRGNHTINPSPKTVLDPPPTYGTFPSLLFTPYHFPQRKRTQTRRIPVSEASKTGFGGGTLQYVSPPPQIARYVLHPCRFPTYMLACIRGEKNNINYDKHKLFEPDTGRENPRERTLFPDTKILC